MFRARPTASTLRALVALAFTFTFVLPVSLAAASPLTPDISTRNASNVTYDSAILHGSVNPRGAETTYFFQYGITRTYGSQTPLSAAGNATSPSDVSEPITGLQALTTYHFRIVASNSAGTTKGNDRTFTTPKIPLSVAIAGVPNPVVFGSSFILEGTLSGTGSSNHQIVLEGDPFPYLGGFKTVGNPELTNAMGGFSFPFLGLRENARLRVVTIGQRPVTSLVLTENVAVRVSFHAHSLGRGFVRLYGTVAPAEVGALVGFQLLQPGHRSRNEGGTAVKAGSATVSGFSRVLHIGRPGLYRALVKVSDAAHVSNYSNPILVR